MGSSTVRATLGAGWTRREPAGDAAIKQLEAALGGTIPADYLEFLQWSNGGEGKVGRAYVSLWRAEEIVRLNVDYGIPKYLPTSVAIGTDGGGMCVAIRRNQTSGAMEVVQVPLGDLDEQSVVVLGDDLATAICVLKAHGFR